MGWITLSVVLRHLSVNCEKRLLSRLQLKCDDTREGKWRGNWRMQWVASTLHTTSEHDVSSITTADAHTPAASSRLNWRPRRFKWTRPFRWKTKSGFCACAITFQKQSTSDLSPFAPNEQFGSHRRIFMQFDILRILNNLTNFNKFDKFKPG